MQEQQPNQNQCASCGAALQGKFCSECGEKKLNEKDKSVMHFFEEFIHILTHADSKFLKSLKYLITKPGFLTSEHLAGRRKKYTSPLSLFFIGNLLYLLIMPVDALNSKYVSQTTGQPYSAMAVKKVEAKMASKHWDQKTMEDMYNHETSKVSKMMLFVLIFIFSVPLSILLFKPGRYYFDHVVFATEFVNFLVFVILLIAPYLLWLVFIILIKVFKLRPEIDVNSGSVMIPVFSAIGIYLIAAIRRVYQTSWIYSIVAGILMLASTIAATILYRYILFHITMSLL
jgi:hypothetical protein